MQPYFVYLMIVFCGLFSVNPTIAAKRIALSFDDAPRSDSLCLDGVTRRHLLLEQLKMHAEVPAIFMVTTKHLEQQDAAVLEVFTAAGQLLGNHSHSHQHPADLGLAAYLEDVATAHQRLVKNQAYQPLYRFPFLDEGRDVAMRDGLRLGLEKLGLAQAYVTVDNYDWYMDHLLQQAMEQASPWRAASLRELYVSEMMASIRFYDEIAQQYLGRSPSHVLLMHENDLAALFLGDLIAALEASGWQLISPLTAYQDPLASELPATLFNNQGRVAALAHLQGASRAALVPENEEESYLDRRFAALMPGTPGQTIQDVCRQARMRLENKQ